MDLKLNTKSCPAWVEANDGATGYYATTYDSNMLSALTTGDVAHRLTATERVDLMGNAAALSKSGRLPAASALALVETFHSDPEQQVVQDALDLALEPRRYVVPENLEPNYRRFLLKNFQAKAHQLGWEPKPGETEDVRLLRQAIVRPVATWGGDQELANQAKQLTEAWFAHREAIDPGMINATLGTAAFYGDKALFDKFLAEFKKSPDKQERARLIGVMRTFRDPAAIQSGMQALLSGDVPFLEGPGLLFNGQQNRATERVPFEFVQAHFEEILKTMPSGGGFDFGAALPRVGASFCDAGSKQELAAFFQPKVDKFVGAPRTLAQVLEGIDLCIATTAQQKPSVEAFLARQ